MRALHKTILLVSVVVIAGELSLLVYFYHDIVQWVSHNLWVILVPFAKAIFKRLVALKLLALLKVAGAVLLNISKLLLLKTVKTLGLRYGVFFSQNKWYWIRRAKVMFLRRGKQFFRSAARFWKLYSQNERRLITVAFFPVVVVLFLLGLSFDITRKTMVKKTKEKALFNTALKTGGKSTGIRAWVERFDRKTLEKIRDLTPRAKPVCKEPDKAQE